MDELMEAWEETNNSVKIARRCNCGRIPGETVVEILIKPEGNVKHFKLIEKIPKGYIDDLDAYLNSMEGDYDYYRVIEDPLIMWHFDEISTDTIVRYTLDKDIMGYCAEILDYVGVGVTFASEGVEPPNPVLNLITESVLDTTAVPLTPKLNGLGIAYIKSGRSNQPVFKEPKRAIWKHLSSNGLTGEKRKDYTYTISYNPAELGGSSASSTLGDVTCEIKSGSLHLICSTEDSFSESTFYIRVLDSSSKLIASGPFTVAPSCNHNTDCDDSNDCTNDICSADEACVYTNLPDGDTCDSGTGTCQKGVCVSKKTISKCEKVAKTGCSGNFKDECAAYYSYDDNTGCCKYCGGNLLPNHNNYKCYDHFETSCMKNSACPSGWTTLSTTDCTSTATTFRVKYSVLAEGPGNCVNNYDDECNDYSYGKSFDGCGWKDNYACYDYQETSCSANPEFPGGIFHSIIECTNCDDGTTDGECSTVNKGQKCEVGTLVNKCSECGCPSGQSCQVGGSCAVA